jgi:putative nucleotidyltransferase with HDIG domain
MSNTVVPLPQLVEKARSLPCAPWLLPKLMEQLAAPDTTADQIEALIKLDSGLATETLRLANSAYFSGSMPCDSFTHAIVRLGFREIYRLATTKIASRWLTNPAQGYSWEPGDLYRHSLTVAVGADLLAKKLGRVTPEIAYTAGLLHDVGKLALAYVCAASFEEIRLFQAEKQCPWREAELALLGYDHTEVAGALLHTWAFPPNLIEVVRFYPRPRLSTAEHRSLVTCVHAAKHLALCLGTGVGEEGFSTELDEALLAEQGITPELIESLLPAVLAGAKKLLQSDSSG